METYKDHIIQSPDMNAERLETLRNLFPDWFTQEGQLDINEIKKAVNPEGIEETERYEFRWFGKSKAKRNAFMPTRATLHYDESRSVNPEKTENVIIEGENLEVLKILLAGYRNKVKVIYIDPPYNTGEDFLYNDNFAENRQAYWERTEQSEDGITLDSNSDASGRFHSNWLDMMYSRLLVARNLLHSDGVIFISIAEHELHHLRKVCDEVFGIENFLAILSRRTKAGGGSASKFFAIENDFVVVYAKDKNSLPNMFIPFDQAYLKRYAYEDEKGKYFWDTMERSCTATIPYLIEAPDGTMLEGNWFRSEERFLQDKADGEVRFVHKDDGQWSVQFKQRMAEGKKLRTLLNDNEFKSSQNDMEELGLGGIFPFPKPVFFLKHILRAGTSANSIVLDFFGGSGTTGQAVTELNTEDNGNRKYILVQVPEITSENSNARRSGFKKISDITIARNKAVAKKVEESFVGKITTFEDQQQLEQLGFKVFTLSRSSFPRTDFAPDPDKSEKENLELFREYIRQKELQTTMPFINDELITEILISRGFMLTYKLEQQPTFTDNTVYLATDSIKTAYICVDSELKDSTVEYFMQHTDTKFICIERALDSTKKFNLKNKMQDKFFAF
ncbi:site-specific DNA-methyltransferase [Xylanibacter muris]|uniref:site-specific DNA-methyltransferase (adenine-specific) n=1 Tax=Xylanibacter muris TaxID=2736290 RepID=A0ABX2APW1_9BACT|nr:site-specific DNA-methyltransferase [Xylanibacter muris]NPD91961.1 site-specific DNA-methyltransferase [Xylanibacter muris]